MIIIREVGVQHAEPLRINCHYFITKENMQDRDGILFDFL